MILLRSLYVFSKKVMVNHMKFQSLTIQTELSMSTNKKTQLDRELQMLADTIAPSASQEDYSETANNYIQLQQGSFSQYAKQNKNDPQMMLMLLSSFEDQNKIADFLPMLYPYIDYYQSSEMLLLMEKVLAFKPKTKPKVPHPKPLENIQSILVILGQIYKADQLIQWMKLVPVYTKKDYYVLFMGYFSILQKMSPELKNRNQTLWVKCHERIASILQDQNQSLQVRVGILTLAFQLNYGQAVPLFLITNIDYQSLDPFKLCLLFINISKYLTKRSVVSEGISEKDQQKIERMFKKCMNQIITAINNTDMLTFMKADLMMDMWTAVKDLKQARGVYLSLANKLTSLFTNKKYLKTISELTTGQLVTIFECLQKHKINNQKALKLMLVLFSEHLENMNKLEFIRLLRCLVTYVRQCEDYLINVRQILEKRRAQFTNQEALQINDILRRVQVLFPRKFAVPR